MRTSGEGFGFVWFTSLLKLGSKMVIIVHTKYNCTLKTIAAMLRLYFKESQSGNFLCFGINIFEMHKSHLMHKWQKSQSGCYETDEACLSISFEFENYEGCENRWSKKGTSVKTYIKRRCRWHCTIMKRLKQAMKMEMRRTEKHLLCLPASPSTIVKFRNFSTADYWGNCCRLLLKFLNFE